MDDGVLNERDLPIRMTMVGPSIRLISSLVFSLLLVIAGLFKTHRTKTTPGLQLGHNIQKQPPHPIRPAPSSTTKSTEPPPFLNNNGHHQYHRPKQPSHPPHRSKRPHRLPRPGFPPQSRIPRPRRRAQPIPRRPHPLLRVNLFHASPPSRTNLHIHPRSPR